MRAALDRSVARGDGNDGHPAVNHWVRWHATRGEPHQRVFDARRVTMTALVEEQWHIGEWVFWLCVRQGVLAKTADGYLSTANAWHHRRFLAKFAGGEPLVVANGVLKALAKDEVRPEPVRRFGTPPQALAVGMDRVLGPRGCSALAQNYRAMIASCFSGLLRGCEAGLQDGVAWRAERNCTRADLGRRSSGRRTLRVRSAKRASLDGVRMGKTDTVALVAGGALVDASAELDALELTDPVAADVRGATPAFRGGDGKPILVSALRRVVKAVMQACGRDPNKYGAHSLRIGGATALFAAGASPLVIKTLGRWWSDAYQIYLRACEEQAAAFLVAAGSNEVHALQDRYDDEDPDDLM